MPTIVVASDGRASSTGAMRLAACLAKRDGRTPALVTVGDTATGQRARALLDAVVAMPTDWTHTIVVGDARDALDALARVDGSLILLGLKVSSPPRTAIAMAASAGIPVLAVPPEIAALPRRAVLAVDFGRASLRAARLAFQLLDRPAHAFVVCPGSPSVDTLVDVFEDSLTRDSDVTVERRRISGDPTATILDVAAAERAALISLGRHGRLTPTGIIPSGLGPVAHAVLSAASCSVLVAPPD